MLVITNCVSCSAPSFTCGENKHLVRRGRDTGEGGEGHSTSKFLLKSVNESY